MSSNLTSLRASGLIGLAIANFMYGASLAQTIHYARFFPNDPSPIKLLVLFIFIADLLHLIGLAQYYWVMLVLCHRSVGTCDINLTWGACLAVYMNFIITFAVQSFYCHRIWIITGGRRGVTLIAFLVAVLQFGIGSWASIATIINGTIEFLYTTPLIAIAATVGTLDDIIITCTIFQYLWRSELRRSNVIRDLVIVFINMGALTCLISMAVGVVYLAQGDDHYWIGAPAAVLSRCYANSLLAVLNARRRIREQESRRVRYTIDIPTLSTII